MTIAGYRLGSQAAPELADHTAEGLARARRTRKMNLWAYFALWVGFYLYALSSAFGASNIAAALDRFLPLQVVAAVAAVAVFLCGRSLRRHVALRRWSLVPAICTLLGATAVLGIVAMEGKPRLAIPANAVQPESEAPAVLVAL